MIQNIELGKGIDFNPLRTIDALSRQRTLQDQETQQNALQLQRLAQQLQESKKKADEETSVKKIIADGGEPQDVYQRLLAVNPDTARTYLTNSQSDILQAQNQALLRAQKIEGQIAPEVTAPAPQTTSAPIQTSLTDPSQMSEPQVSEPGTQQVPLPLPGVDVPFIGQPTTRIQPQSAQQKTLAQRAEEEFKSRLASRAKIEDQAAQAKANLVDIPPIPELGFPGMKGVNKEIADNIIAALKPKVLTFEEQAAADWLKENPGKNKNDYQTMDANRKKPAPEGSSITTESLDMLATVFAKTGQLPALGTGVAAAGDRRRIFNRAAELFPKIDIAGNSADFAANKVSETSLQRNRDAVVAFENTALKNLDQFLSAAKGVIDSGSPWINQPLRTIAQQGLGSKDLAAFNAARQVAINEIAKVTTNPNLTGQLSDTARREVEAFVPTSATLKQVFAVANILKADMKNRHDSLDEQLGEIQKRIKNSLSSGTGSTTIKVINGKQYNVDSTGKVISAVGPN